MPLRTLRRPASLTHHAVVVHARFRWPERAPCRPSACAAPPAAPDSSASTRPLREHVAACRRRRHPSAVSFVSTRGECDAIGTRTHGSTRGQVTMPTEPLGLGRGDGRLNQTNSNQGDDIDGILARSRTGSPRQIRPR